MFVVFSLLFLDGQAQVLLKQSVSITRGQGKTAWIECIAEGISNFQSAIIHWYRHIPSKAPERILYIGSGQASYDDNAYRSKYSSSKRGTNVCTFLINGINSDDEGTYYCAYWKSHRTSRPQAASTESCPSPAQQASCQMQRTTVVPSCH